MLRSRRDPDTNAASSGVPWRNAEPCVARPHPATSGAPSARAVGRRILPSWARARTMLRSWLDPDTNAESSSQPCTNAESCVARPHPAISGWPGRVRSVGALSETRSDESRGGAARPRARAAAAQHHPRREPRQRSTTPSGSRASAAPHRGRESAHHRRRAPTVRSGPFAVRWQPQVGGASGAPCRALRQACGVTRSASRVQRHAFWGKPRLMPPWLGSSQREVTTLPRVKKCTPSVPWAWVSPNRLFFQPPKE